MALLVYGANGYTGELIARRAAAVGVPAVLAGRNEGAVAALAAELGREHRAFALDDDAALDRVLSGITVVLNCAGPFSRTAAPLVTACLRARAHYLDITGEIAVLEALAGRDAEARAAGIALLPGRASTSCRRTVWPRTWRGASRPPPTWPSRFLRARACRGERR